MDKRTSRACVFIDSSNPALPSQVINGAQPFIKPPFPPTIQPRDLLKKSRDGSMTKAPNAFIIYRKLFIATARSDGYYLPMTVISSMASQSWEQEPLKVKNEYKRLAKETFNLRNDLLPKSIRRRKREKWNIVTFDDEEDVPHTAIIKKPSSPKQKPKKVSKPQTLSPASPPESPESPDLLPSPNSPTLSPESPESPESPLSSSSPISPISISINSPEIPPSSPNSSDNELAQFIIPSPTSPIIDETYLNATDWFSSPEPDDERYLLNMEQFGLMLDQPHHRQEYLELFNSFEISDHHHVFSSFLNY